MQAGSQGHSLRPKCSMLTLIITTMLFCKVSTRSAHCKRVWPLVPLFFHSLARSLQSALLKTPNLDRIVALGFTETPLVVYTPVNHKGGCKPQGRPKAMGDTLFNLHYKPISVDLIEPASWCKHKRSHAASHVQSMHICMMQI